MSLERHDQYLRAALALLQSYEALDTCPSCGAGYPHADDCELQRLNERIENYLFKGDHAIA